MVCIDSRARLTLLRFRIHDTERTSKRFYRTQYRRDPDLMTHRFFFVVAAAFRAGGGSEESDGIESSDVGTSSRTLEERVLRVALAGAGWVLALPLA